MATQFTEFPDRRRARGRQSHRHTGKWGQPLGNRNSGILVRAPHNRIGGLEPAAGNVIAHNGATGISLRLMNQSFPAVRNVILSNRIYANAGIGIDLENDGPTPNDLGDRDVGSNDRQNFPVITRVQPNDQLETVIRGGLDSTPSTSFTIQLFENEADNQGQRLLDTFAVVTGSRGAATFESRVFLDAQGTVTATATDPIGNTSEFTPQNGPVQLANISTRAFVGTGADILIGGFIVRSDQPKRVGVRALGPSINLPNRLSDPYLELYDSNGTLLAKNDDWRTGQQQEITSAGLAPSSDVESVLIATLPAGNYTAQVSGVNGKTAVGVVELYDLDAFTATSGRLVNISTRGAVGTGDNVLIGGLIVRGDAAARVVARAIGPDLSARGVPDALQDPVLELRDANGDLVAENDNWRQNKNEPRPTRSRAW